MQHYFTGTIDTIPEEFLGCEKLIFDDVKKLPDNLSECKNIKHIEVIFSDIDEFDTTNLQLESLYFLECYNIQNFLDDIKKIKTLVSIFMERCDLDHIPDFSMLTNLKELKLKQQMITEIPNYVSSFTTTLINLEKNMITTIENIPSCIEVLILSYNDIESCSDVKNFKYLNIFDVSYNEIEHIPAFDGCDKLLIVNGIENNVISSDDNIINGKKLIFVECDDGVLDELKFKHGMRTQTNKNVLNYFKEYY